MENKKMVSKRFWRALACMLGGFILICATVVICWNSFAAVSVEKDSAGSGNESNGIVQQQQNGATFEDRFNATQDRVNELNGNYGQGIKSAYAGSNSVVEKMMQQRMVFNAIKSLLIIVLLAMVILLVLVKGFNVLKFRKKVAATVSGESEEEPDVIIETEDEEEPTDEAEAEADPETEENNAPKELGSGAEADQPAPDVQPETDVKADEKDADAKETDVKEADEKEVAESCQLP